MSELNVVGRTMPAVGSCDIVTGRARYCPDLRFPGMLVGKLLYSPHASARITHLDVSKARRLPGVAAVLTGYDIPGENSYLYAIADQPLLVVDQIRYVGDAIAAVAAETEELAQAALDAIEVIYEPLPGVYDPLEAMQTDAIQVWPGRSNVCGHTVIRRGDVEAGFKASDLVIERTYCTSRVEHAFMETEGAVARVDDDGTMVVYSSCQTPHRDRQQIARALGVPESMVRVIVPYVGGGFGGKDEATVQMHAALLAWASRRPVSLIRSRKESILTHVKRHPLIVRIRTGTDSNGMLLAMEVEAVADTGPYLNAGAEVMDGFAQFAAGPYKTPHVCVESFTVHTNNPIGGSFRGFGTPQACFVHEAQMDELARVMGIDPLELRLLNGIETGDRVYAGAVLREGWAAKESLRRAAAMIGWSERFKVERKPASHLRRGWGLALGWKGIGMGRGVPDSAGASVDMAADGSVILRSAATDMGQGASTVLAQIAAEALGVEMAAIRVLRPDTQMSTDAGPTVASRQTFVSGNAILQAAQIIRQSLLEVAEAETGIPLGLLSLRRGRLYTNDGPMSITVGQLATKAWAQNRRLHAEGFYAMEYPEAIPEEAHPIGHGVFSFAAQAAQVLVDIGTGQVLLERLVAVNDAGTVINPGGAYGQVEGGCTQGIGYALMENLLVEQGHILNSSLATYLVPTSLDIPQIDICLLERPEPYAPFGAKGLGESSILPTAPAIRNAVLDAVGVSVDELPLDGERVLAAIEARLITGQAQVAPPLSEHNR